MTLEYKQSLTELNTIIHYMDIEYLKKLPRNFIEFVNSNMDTEYVPNIDKSIPINEQNLKEDTKVLLSLLYRNYWCDEEKKENLINQDLLEKQKYEEQMHEKYNPDNLFKDRTQKEEQRNKNVALLKYEKISWYKKIIKNIRIWIARMFKKESK